MLPYYATNHEDAYNRMPVSPDFFCNTNAFRPLVHSAPVDSAPSSPYERPAGGLPTSAFDDLITVSTAALQSEDLSGPNLQQRLAKYKRPLAQQSSKAARPATNAQQLDIYGQPRDASDYSQSESSPDQRRSVSMLSSPGSKPKPKRAASRRKLPPATCTSCTTQETPGVFLCHRDYV